MYIRGSWRPARLTNADTVSLTSVLVLIAFLYSGDYLTGDDRSSGTLSVIEMAAPLWLWGYGIGLAGVILGVGILQRVHRLVWSGHWLLFSISTLISAGALQTAFISGGDGIRGFGITGFVAMMHLLFALRMGTRPLEPGQATPTEIVYEGAEANHKES